MSTAFLSFCQIYFLTQLSGIYHVRCLNWSFWKVIIVILFKTIISFSFPASVFWCIFGVWTVGQIKWRSNQLQLYFSYYVNCISHIMSTVFLSFPCVFWCIFSVDALGCWFCRGMDGWTNWVEKQSIGDESFFRQPRNKDISFAVAWESSCQYIKAK